ncbi:hypothetical protein T492DRAFT_168277 [Pavlovales sp. CCMP2436]|nr:hypothetical protein T492DRAFT_168277 [Pavlovales sp. CCMP2436]
MSSKPPHGRLSSCSSSCCATEPVTRTPRTSPLSGIHSTRAIAQVRVVGGPSSDSPVALPSHQLPTSSAPSERQLQRESFSHAFVFGFLELVADSSGGPDSEESGLPAGT